MSDQDFIDFIRTARQVGKNDTEIVGAILRDETSQSSSTAPGIATPRQDEASTSAGPTADTRNDNKEILIRIRNLSKTYVVSRSVQVPALKNIHLDIYQGEFVAVTGQSGSGKSTFLNLLALIDDPTEGTIEVAGKRLDSLHESDQVAFRLRTASMVFQFFNLIENYTASENIILPLLLQGTSYRAAKQKSIDMLQYLGLAGKANAYPKDLSGGQQQRIAVGRALAKESLFILADEPTAHLDAKTGQELIDLFKDINKKFNRTIIMVSHEPEQAAQADRAITLRDGELENIKIIPK